MDDMAREEVQDIDAIAADLLARGLLRRRLLQGTVIPVFGVDHKRRRRFGIE